MEQTLPRIEYQVSSLSPDALPMVVVAAGSSSRMGGIDKQFALIGGVPVLAKTLMTLEASPLISAIIVVVREEVRLSVQQLAETYMITKLSDLVVGGSTRQESVANGLSCLPSSVQKVLIHDGARPLIDEPVIDRVVTALKTYPAVACGLPVTDTIKRLDDEGNVLDTPDRSRLFAVQTPQGVWLNEYRDALGKAEDFSSFTDDLSVMEAAGYPVSTVEGSRRNLKITTPEDLALAEYYIRKEPEE